MENISQKLLNTEKSKTSSTNNDYLILVIYLMLITFVIFMIFIISQGDKHNPHKIHTSFKGDKPSITVNDYSIWEKLHYIIFGKYPSSVSGNLSRTDHLECTKSNNCYISTDVKNNTNNDDKYSYLNIANYNIKKDVTNCRNNVDNPYSYLSQFDESRKCLVSNTALSNGNNKYYYLNILDDELD